MQADVAKEEDGEEEEEETAPSTPSSMDETEDVFTDEPAENDTKGSKLTSSLSSRSFRKKKSGDELNETKSSKASLAGATQSSLKRPPSNSENSKDPGKNQRQISLIHNSDDNNLKRQEVNQRRQHIAASKDASAPGAYQAGPVMTRKQPPIASSSRIGPSSGHSDDNRLKKQEVNQRRQHIAASKEASAPGAYQAHPVMTRKQPPTSSSSKIGPSSGHSDGIDMKKQKANQRRQQIATSTNASAPGAHHARPIMRGNKKPISSSSKIAPRSGVASVERSDERNALLPLAGEDVGQKNHAMGQSNNSSASVGAMSEKRAIAERSNQRRRNQIAPRPPSPTKPSAVTGPLSGVAMVGRNDERDALLPLEAQENEEEYETDLFNAVENVLANEKAQKWRAINGRSNVRQQARIPRRPPSPIMSHPSNGSMPPGAAVPVEHVERSEEPDILIPSQEDFDGPDAMNPIMAEIANEDPHDRGYLLSAELVDEDAQKRKWQEDMLAEARLQVVAEAVEASAVILDTDNYDRAEEKQYRRKLYLCLGLLACVVIIAVVVAVATVVTKNMSPSSATTLSPVSPALTPSPTSIPTPPPTSMPTPTPAPPTLMPSSFPSAAPSINNLNKNNDNCEDAISVTSDGTIYSGDLYNATQDLYYLTYTSFAGSSQSSHGGLGRWYSFIGNGLDTSVLHLAGNLTPIVLTGTCSGGTLDSNDATVANSEGDSIEYIEVYNGFPTNINVQYWLLVYAEEKYLQSLNESIFAEGYVNTPFQTLSIPYEFSLVSQAYCEGASQLSASQEVTKLLSSGAVAAGVPSCGSASVPVAKGVWFYIQENQDKSYRLSTEGSLGLDTQLSVLEGHCNDLQCIAGNNDAPFKYDGHSLVQFPGYAGIRYSILLHGTDEADIGSFVLKVEDFPINDIPNGAIPINLTSTSAEGPTTIVGSTIAASAGGAQNHSCVYGTNSPSVWYSVNGIDSYVSAYIILLKIKLRYCHH
jgi:hypothetical protein